jgi:ATP-dependent protease HslVU (ClpYQ) peptidase subunit
LYPAASKRSLVVGITGTFRFGQLLMTLTLPKDEQPNPFEYLLRSFIPTVRQALREGGHLRKHEEVEELAGGSAALVVYGRRLFTIYRDLQVAEDVGRFAAIGQGSDVALGALAAITSRRAPTAKDAIAAIRIASRFCPGVRPPVKVLAA